MPTLLWCSVGVGGLLASSEGRTAVRARLGAERGRTYAPRTTWQVMAASLPQQYSNITAHNTVGSKVVTKAVRSAHRCSATAMTN